jgi:hypothetical protein
VIAIPAELAGTVEEITPVEEAVAALEAALGAALEGGLLTCGQINSILHKVEAALEAAVRGNCEAALNIVNAAINEVQAILGLSSETESALNQLQHAIRTTVCAVVPL